MPKTPTRAPHPESEIVITVRALILVEGMLTMVYRILGRTGLRVSEIGFGCGNVGGLIIRGTQGERVEAVKRAVELGINYFDTAPSYGDGRSETNLGEVLDELQPDVVVATRARRGRSKGH